MPEGVHPASHSPEVQCVESMSTLQHKCVNGQSIIWDRPGSATPPLRFPVHSPQVGCIKCSGSLPNLDLPLTPDGANGGEAWR